MGCYETSLVVEQYKTKMTIHILVLSKSETCRSVSADSQLGTLTVLSQSWKSSFVCKKTNVFQTVPRLERHLQCRHLNSYTGENNATGYECNLPVPTV